MRLHSLHLSDFRGFEQLHLEFEPEVTVLVGVNGAGKSSILDAIALSLTHLTARIRGDTEGGELSQDDIRLGAGAARIGVLADIDGERPLWWLTAHRPGFPVDSLSDVTALVPAIVAAQRSIAEGKPRLPLPVYFPTNRSALDIPARIRTPHEFDAINAYDGALEGGASNFRGFFEWFREEEDIYNEQQLTLDHGGIAWFPSKLPVVRRAIETLFPSAVDLRIERRPQRMTLSLHGIRLDVAQLSDGEKCLLAMAGDLARRMVLAAPDAANPLAQAAVVLIDEIELHLHPGAQRTILPRLRTVFPNTQFIVSTHSPQVLSSVQSKHVRLLEGFAVRPLQRSTWRRDTNRILEAAFGDPGRPPEVAEKLNALRDAVDDERYDDARALVHALHALVEGQDPDVFFLEQLIPPESSDGGGAAP